MSFFDSLEPAAPTNNAPVPAQKGQSYFDALPQINSNDQVQSPATGEQFKNIAQGAAVGAAKGAADVYDFALTPLLTDTGLVPADASMREKADKYLPEPKNKVAAAAGEGGVSAGPFGWAGAAIGAGSAAGTEYLNQVNPDHPVENTVYPSILSMALSPGLFRQGLRAGRLGLEGMRIMDRDPLVQARIDQGITKGTPASVSDEDFWYKMQRSLRESMLGTNINKTAGEEVPQLEAAVDRQANTLGPEMSKQEVGTQVRGGVVSGVDMAKQAFGQEEQTLQHMVGGAANVDVDMTPFIRRAYNELGSGPGAARPLGGNNVQLGNKMINDLVDNISDYGRGGQLSLEAIQKLKSQTGDKLTESLLNGSADKNMYRLMYGILADAQESAYANTAGGVFLPRYQQLKAAEAQMYKSIDDFAQPLIRDGLTPEKVADRLSSEMKLGSTKLDETLKIINNPAIRDMYAGSILRNLGANRKGEFDPNRFFTNWQQMAPEAKQALFANQSGTIAKDYDQLALIAQNQARGRAAVNPSQTAGTLHILNELTSFAGIAGGALGYASGNKSDQSGTADSPWARAAEGAAGGAALMKTAGTFGISRLMTNPMFIRWLATPTPLEALPMHIRALSAIAGEAPEIKQFQNYLMQNVDQTRQDKPRFAEGGLFDTKLTPEEELQYQVWKAKNAPNDSGEDYDMRGAFKAGLSPADNGHWSDEFKKPNHQTFSNESKYSRENPDLPAGSWQGDHFFPPAQYAEGGSVSKRESAEANDRASKLQTQGEGYFNPVLDDLEYNVAPFSSAATRVPFVADNRASIIDMIMKKYQLGETGRPNAEQYADDLLFNNPRDHEPQERYAEGGPVPANENEGGGHRSNLIDLFMGHHMPLGGGGAGGPKSPNYYRMESQAAPQQGNFAGETAGYIGKQTPKDVLNPDEWQPSSLWTTQDIAGRTPFNANENTSDVVAQRLQQLRERLLPQPSYPIPQKVKDALTYFDQLGFDRKGEALNSIRNDKDWMKSFDIRPNYEFTNMDEFSKAKDQKNYQEHINNLQKYLGSPVGTYTDDNFAEGGPVNNVDSTLNLIQKYESPKGNVPNFRFDPKHTAQGYFQITNTTWKGFAPQEILSKYPNAMSAPYDVQRQVAKEILTKGGIQHWSNYNPQLAAALGKGDTTNLASSSKSPKAAEQVVQAQPLSQTQESAPSVIQQFMAENDNNDDEDLNKRRQTLAQEHIEAVPWAEPLTKYAIKGIWDNANI